jgi:PAS domain S-box-containing protein
VAGKASAKKSAFKKILRQEAQKRRKIQEKVSLSNLMLKLSGSSVGTGEYLSAVNMATGSISGCSSTGIRFAGAVTESFFAAQQGFGAEQTAGLGKINTAGGARKIKVRNFFINRMKNIKDLRYGSFFTGNSGAMGGGFRAGAAGNAILKFFRRNFMSFCFVPVMYRGVITAYIVAADEKEGLLDIQKIKLLEWISPMIGEGIEKFSRESEAKRGRELLEKMFSITSRRIAYMDRDFNYLKVNETYADSTGTSPEKLEGKNHFQIFPGVKNLSVFKGVVEEGEPYYVYGRPFDFPGIPENQPALWDWTIEPIKNGSYEVEGILLTLTDATRRIRTQDKLFEAQKELLRNKRLADIGMLAATVAHELKNPLSVINAAAYNIRKASNDASVGRRLETIEKKVSESTEIIDNMLSYASIRPPRYSKFSLCWLLNDCVKNAKKRSGKDGVKIEKKTSGIKKRLIEADQLQIREVICNILNNAFQAVNGKDGKITVAAAEKNGFFEIDITDNGVGIDEAGLKRIFTPFYTSKANGTGLGLSVCREIVNLHNGKIYAKSTKNKGASFFVNLPAKRFPPPAL